jgi:hypothetical protein
MHKYITTQIDSSLPDLFTTFRSPSHIDLCRFKVAILAPLQWTHQILSSFGFPAFTYSSCMCSPLNAIILFALLSSARVNSYTSLQATLFHKTYYLLPMLDGLLFCSHRPFFVFRIPLLSPYIPGLFLCSISSLVHVSSLLLTQPHWHSGFMCILHIKQSIFMLHCYSFSFWTLKPGPRAC